MTEAAINEVYLEKERAEAEKGMLNIQRKTMHPGYRIFRFASKVYRVDWLTSAWWIGFSPYGTVDQLADGDQDRLSRVARAALAVAVDPNKSHFNQMDVLLSARINATLSAWTGRPKTITLKRDKKYVERWEPDPTVTQLYIPGLGKIPAGALTLESQREIPSRASFHAPYG